MAFDSYKSIESLSPEFLEAVVEYSGRPDNFVDSPEGSFVGMPDIETDPSSIEIMKQLDETITELGARALGQS
jgi:hypothetical protein